MLTKTTAASAVAVAVVATSLFAGTASAAGVTATKAAPGKAALGVATPVAIAGTGFSNAVAKVQFGADADCVSSGPVITSATLLWVTSPTHADCVAGAQTVKLLKSDDTVLATLTPTANGSNTVTFVAPAGVSSAAVDKSSGVAGTKVTFTGLTGLVASGLSATLGGKPVGAVKFLSATSFSGVVPAGLAPGDAPLQVRNAGVLSAEKTGLFTSKLAVKVTPNLFTAGATAPYVKVEGVGFKPVGTAKQYVSFCGVQAPVLTAAVAGTQVKAPTDTALWVQAPTFALASAGTVDGKVSGTSGADGGLCAVKVTVDPLGTDTLATTTTALAVTEGEAVANTPDTDDYSSVMTATSGFVYAAF